MKPTAVVLTTLVVALVAACNTGPTETQPTTPRAPQEPAVAPAPVASPTAPVPAIAPASAPIPSATPSPAPPAMPVVPPGTLSEVTPAHVEAAFPEHVIRDNGLEGYYVSKDHPLRAARLHRALARQGEDAHAQQRGRVDLLVECYGIARRGFAALQWEW